MAKKLDAPLYDSHGRWVEERGRIKGAMRRTFRLSPQMKEVLQRARVELPPALKKDGTPGARNQVRYRCAICGELYSQKFVQVDHIVPVVPLHKKESELSYDDMARGIFCPVSNLQVVCSTPKKLTKDGKPSCHSVKTNEENFIRDKIANSNILSPSVSQIEEFKKEYGVYLQEQDRIRREKLERKLAREAKKLKGR